MKKANVFILGLFSLIILCLTGCEKKDVYEYMVRNLEGKWKLSTVSYMDTRVLHGESHTKIDYPKTAIYDFQKNNKLVVTYFLSGELYQSEHMYKCEKENYNPLCNDMGSGTCSSIRLHIDESQFLCVAFPESMWIYGFTKDKVIDDVDLVMVEHDYVKDGYVKGWSKSFVKIK